jgi:Arc/MetJ-type ribon-helix-helix transcriptional regulator
MAHRNKILLGVILIDLAPKHSAMPNLRKMVRQAVRRASGDVRMEIHLPEDLQQFVREQVDAGLFASEGDVVRAAVDQFRRQPATVSASTTEAVGPGSIGAMREDAELLDRIVEEAMNIRRSRPLRVAP